MAKIAPPPLSVPTFCELFHTTKETSLGAGCYPWRMTTSGTPFLPLFEHKAPPEVVDVLHYHSTFLVPACGALPPYPQAPEDQLLLWSNSNNTEETKHFI